jgi:hypothetical protein
VSLPAFAAWRHRDARDGFEVVFFDDRDDHFRCELVYDAAGLVLDYPGIASRAA